MNEQSKHHFWMSKCKDKFLLKELKAMTDEQIVDAFYKDLEFGTAGLRGVMGAGTNRMNVYTVAQTTKGLADYILANSKTPSAAICYDSRNLSEEFAHRTAEVLCAAGVTVYLSHAVNPTPYLSFMVRSFNCTAGIMITASHNPAKYNGYKVYGDDGCQCTEEAASAVYENIKKTDCFSVESVALKTAIKNGQCKLINIEKQYLDAVLARSIESIDNVKVAFTPLNGAGYRLVPQALKACGVSDIVVVDEQSMPNGDFLTCSYPNPERKETMELCLKLAKDTDADIAIGTDPDCDRMGVAVKHNNDYVQFTGNEIGVLLTDYLMANSTLPPHPVIVKSIVSTDLALKVAQSYGATAVETLTGFKYIGETIKNLEKENRGEDFVFGFEESCGYLSGTYVRDKDAVVASMLTCEMVSNYKKKGMTLVDRLNEIYEKFGRYIHKSVPFTFEGEEGSKRMKEILRDLRNAPITEIAGEKVTETIDYLSQTKLALPKADVLSYKTKSGNGIIIRPSGTEPLIKAYITVAVGGEEKLNEMINQVKLLMT